MSTKNKKKKKIFLPRDKKYHKNNQEIMVRNSFFVSIMNFFDDGEMKQFFYLVAKFKSEPFFLSQYINFLKYLSN